MREIVVELHIDQDSLLRLYRGSATAVVAKAIDGRRVKFPAARLRDFVEEDGVNGLFRITFDENNRLVSLARV